MNTTNTEIWNIYGTADVGKYQTSIYRKLTDELIKTTYTKIICGDFNIITEPQDAKKKKLCTPAAKIWKKYTEVDNIKYAWRWRNPRRMIYTVSKTHQARRVDRIYTSDHLLAKITRCVYKLNTTLDTSTTKQ